MNAGAAMTLAQELPVAALPADPAWRENFCFDGYDAVREIGFWVHLGRWSLDPSLWREQVHLMLPGGRLVVARGFGRREVEMSAAGPCMAFTCAAPGKAWRLAYHGPGRETSRAQLASAPIPEGPRALLDFDIAFESGEGVWDFGAAARGEDWASAHYEQTGRAHGRVTFDGEAFEIDGFGWRDHSRGPRNLSNHMGHCWIHGAFEGGRSFALCTIRQRNAAPFAKGMIFENGRLFEATCGEPPYLETTAWPEAGYAMTLDGELGPMRIEAQPKTCLPHSSTEQYETYDGVAAGLARHVTYEQGTVFRWDGRAGQGHTERSAVF